MGTPHQLHLWWAWHPLAACRAMLLGLLLPDPRDEHCPEDFKGKAKRPSSGTVLLTPNERRVAEDRRECYWLYVVTNCKSTPELQNPIKDPACFPWHEVKKVDHYYLSVDALTQPMQVKEHQSSYGDT